MDEQDLALEEHTTEAAPQTQPGAEPDRSPVARRSGSSRP